MFRSRVAIIGFILIAIAISLQYLTGPKAIKVDDLMPPPKKPPITGLLEEPRPVLPRPAAAQAPIPPQPSSQTPSVVQAPGQQKPAVSNQVFMISATPGTPGLFLIDEAECARVLETVKSIDNSSFSRTRTVAEYNYECVNIFVPKITSSREQDLKSSDQHTAESAIPSPEKLFKLILNSADISYVGYFNTPDGIVAMFRVNNSDMNIVKAGEIISNSNLRLKAANERFAVLENLIDRSSAKVYISQR